LTPEKRPTNQRVTRVMQIQRASSSDKLMEGQDIKEVSYLLYFLLRIGKKDGRNI
jgi:hypothetical protein